jgi:hypothetical protein
MGQMFDKTRNRMNNWMWDKSCAFRSQFDLSNLQTTCSGMVKPTVERFPCYGIEHLMEQIEPPSCRQYTAGEFLAVRLLNWDEIIDEDDDDDNMADPGGPSG